MMGNDDARFLEGLRYGQALLNEGRSRLHKSVPGALVAEVLDISRIRWRELLSMSWSECC